MGARKATVTMLAVAVATATVLVARDQHDARASSPVANVVMGRDGGGDGGPAARSLVEYPKGIALGPDGAVWVTERVRSRVRRIDPDGSISSPIGTGWFDSVGDGGAATDAGVHLPSGVAVAPDGTVYVSEDGGHRIRAVAPDGTITTVVGDGVAGGSGDGGPGVDARIDEVEALDIGPDGSVYMVDSGLHRVRTLRPDGTIVTVAGSGHAGFGGDGDPATAAQLRQPSGVAVGADGTVYIADEENDRIRAVDPVTGVITTVAGTGVAGYSGDGGPATAAQLDDPHDLDVGPDGALYLTDEDNHRIRRVDADGVITTVAGNGSAGLSGDGGPATAARLRGPEGVAVDDDGRIWIADTDNHRVRLVDRDGTISTVAGAGLRFDATPRPATEVDLSTPDRVTFLADGSLLVTDDDVSVIWRVGPDGNASVFAGDGRDGYGGDGGPAPEALLRDPKGMVQAADGSVLVADEDNHVIRRVDPAGTITTIAGTGTAGFSGDGGPATAAWFDDPYDLALASDGTLYVADEDNHRVRRIAPDGIITTVAGTGTAGFSGDGGPAASAQLDLPIGVTLAGDEVLYVAERGSHRVRRVDLTTGVISTVAGTGAKGSGGDGGPGHSAALNTPLDVATGPDGTVYVADTGNHRVRAIDPAGTIRTVLGTGSWTRGRPGRPGPETAVPSPRGVAVSPHGTLAVTSAAGRRVWVLASPAGPPAAPAPSTTVPSTTVPTTVGPTITIPPPPRPPSSPPPTTTRPPTSAPPTGRPPAPRPEAAADQAWVVTDRGRVVPLNGSRVLPGGPASSAPVVAASPTRTGAGAWLAAADGTVHAVGDAVWSGDMGEVPLNSPIIAMATTPGGDGYWLLGEDGGVFSFGGAAFHGSTGGLPLQSPVVDLVATPTGGGYWLVATDGGVFAFGDAAFAGSAASLPLVAPVVSAAAGPEGYWLVAGDGGVFAFGGAPFHGADGGAETSAATRPVRRVRAVDDGAGYLVLDTGGRVRGFGTASSGVAPLAPGESAADLLVAPG